MDCYSKPPIEIFNSTLQVLGYNNLDVSVAGLCPDCKLLLHFLKYYFADMLSLENISQDNTMQKSGYDRQNGGIVINYNATFSNTNSQLAQLYVFTQSTKILTICAGSNLELV